MARLSAAERQKLAETRLLRVLRRHGIATWRTLEQKIADAGPNHMRVDPHILTPVRRRLEEKGVIRRHQIAGGTWFSFPETSEDVINARLALQRPVYEALQADDFRKRLGQTLEIAIARALQEQDQLSDTLGHYLDLEEHDDTTLYRKEEPPRRLGARDIGGDRRLDFLTRHPTAGWAGIEAKNIREWMYPDRSEIVDLLSKCIALDVVPVLVARRIHFSTFVVLNPCGVVMHQTYNQLFPAADAALADRARHKENLGYHDIRVGNVPDNRLARFIHDNLPATLPAARERFEEFKDLLHAFADGEMDYAEFAARVRRRRQGQNEDNDWDDPEVPF